MDFGGLSLSWSIAVAMFISVCPPSDHMEVSQHRHQALQQHHQQLQHRQQQQQQQQSDSCPHNYWNKPLKRCSKQFIDFLDHLTPKESWDTLHSSANTTCTIYQEMLSCHRHLSDECQHSEDGLRDIRNQMNRFWIYEVFCSQENMRRHKELLTCLLPYMKPSRMCTQAYENYFRNYASEKQFRNACRIVSTALKCFHDIRKELKSRCRDPLSSSSSSSSSSSISSSSSSSLTTTADQSFSRHLIQPLIDESRFIVTTKCRLQPPYSHYFASSSSSLTAVEISSTEAANSRRFCSDRMLKKTLETSYRSRLKIRSKPTSNSAEKTESFTSRTTKRGRHIANTKTAFARVTMAINLLKAFTKELTCTANWLLRRIPLSSKVSVTIALTVARWRTRT